MRVAFAGSPAAALPVLDALASSDHEIALVISQPDRRRARRGAPEPTAVATRALDLGLPTLRPDSINSDEALARLHAADVGALAVAAFGQLLKADVLEGWPCVNVHYSLLPAYRGAAPVERAIMDGATESGVTIMQMDAGLDTGPMISSEPVAIGAEEDAGSVLARMGEVGGRLLVAALDDLAAGRLETREQPHEGVSLAPRIQGEDTLLDPARSARELADQVRALSPHIGARLGVGGETFKVWAARAVTGPPEPGLRRHEDRLLLGTGSGTLEITEIQPPNKSRMATGDFLRGRRGALELDVR